MNLLEILNKSVNKFEKKLIKESNDKIDSLVIEKTFAESEKVI